MAKRVSARPTSTRSSVRSTKAKKGNAHLAVNALAGTGKTTTICWGLTKTPSGVQLSDEQRLIIDEINRIRKNVGGKDAKIAVQAFNKSISLELAERLPESIEARTCNAFGHRAWGSFVGKRLFLEANKSRKLFREIYDSMPYKERIQHEGIVSDMVSYLKTSYNPEYHDQWLSPDNLNMLARYYNVPLMEQHHDMVVKVMDRSVKEKTLIDFDDQLFYPIYFDIAMPQFDLLAVDECQDLNLVKQLCAYKMSNNIIIIGDVHQAIYGFSGADSDAMPRMISTLSANNGCTQLALTMTRRCSRAVVAEANQYVPELVAHESNLDGSVDRLPARVLPDVLYHRQRQNDGELMVICSTNAPLTKLAFKLIAQSARCFIQGRDIGTSLKSAITKTGQQNVVEAYIKACDEIDKQMDKESRSKFPSEEKLELFRDRKTCLGILTQGIETVDDFVRRVDDLFKDAGRPGDIRLSSGHKSKGLEADHTYILKPECLGIPFNRKDPNKMELEQAKNLAYVQVTRAKDTITYIETENEPNSGE